MTDKLSWKIFICFHRKLNAHNFLGDPNFNGEYYQAIKTNGHTRPVKMTDSTKEKYQEILGIKITRESEFEIYKPELQPRKYHAPSVLYHLFVNKIYKELDYIGLIEYDHQLKFNLKDSKTCNVSLEGSVTTFINDTLEKSDEIIISLSARWRFIHLYKQGGTQINRKNCIDVFIADYNNYFETQYKIRDLKKKNPIIPTQQSFITDKRTFKRIMGFITHIIDKYPHTGYRPRPSTVLERYIGLALYLDKTELIYAPINHLAKRGY